MSPQKKKVKKATKAKKVKPAQKKRPVKAKKKSATKKRPVKKAKPKKAKAPAVLAVVTHYYDRIGVAILKIKAPLRVGEFVIFRRGTQEFTQPVSSLQIEHKAVSLAKKGALVGLKVKEPVRVGAIVVPA